MFKKVVVAVGLGDGVGELLEPLKEMNFLDHSEIHLRIGEIRTIFHILQL
jgi:hypothetical protein